MSKRAKFKSTVSGVAFTYWDEDAARLVTREFCAPTRHGYVRELTDDGRNPQVCEMLYSNGTTLMASQDTLMAVVRREWKRRQAAERKAVRS